MKLLSTVVLLSLLLSGACRAEDATRYNVLFIISDDLTATALSCYGNTVCETPHIDSIAARGMRFTNAYAASPVCSPTRASILTGKHPARLDITDWIGGQQRGMLLPAEYERQLPLDEITIAEQFKKQGYMTSIVGKWHLGTEEKFSYYHQGFDRYYGAPDNMGHSPKFYDERKLVYENNLQKPRR